MSCLNGEFFYGLGFHSFLDDYKFLVGQCDNGPASAIAEIFSCNTNCWKQCEKACYEHLHGPGKIREEGIYFHGSLHGLSKEQEGGKCTIMSFDMREERFKDETLPLPCLHPDGLGVTKEDCLLVHRGENSLQLEAWIMKDGCSWSTKCILSPESLPTNKYWIRFITFTRDKKFVFNM